MSKFNVKKEWKIKTTNQFKKIPQLYKKFFNDEIKITKNLQTNAKDLKKSLSIFVKNLLTNGNIISLKNNRK